MIVNFWQDVDVNFVLCADHCYHHQFLQLHPNLDFPHRRVHHHRRRHSHWSIVRRVIRRHFALEALELDAMLLMPFYLPVEELMKRLMLVLTFLFEFDFLFLVFHQRSEIEEETQKVNEIVFRHFFSYEIFIINITRIIRNINDFIAWWTR